MYLLIYSFKKIYFYLSVCADDHGGQKGALDPLELELQSWDVNPSSDRAVSLPTCRAISGAPVKDFLIEMIVVPFGI